MVSYKDRTYCPYYLLCSDGYCCERALTPEIREEAMRQGLPTCQYAEFPDCFVRLWEGRGDAG